MQVQTTITIVLNVNELDETTLPDLTTHIAKYSKVDSVEVDHENTFIMDRH